MAARSRILTSRSSNCSSTSCHRDFPSSAGSSVNSTVENIYDFSQVWLGVDIGSKVQHDDVGGCDSESGEIAMEISVHSPLGPNFSRFFLTWSCERPRSVPTLKLSQHSRHDFHEQESDYGAHPNKGEHHQPGR